MPTNISVLEDSSYTRITQFAGGGSSNKTVYVDDPPVGGRLYYTRADAPTTYILLGTGTGVGERNVTIYFKPDADFAGDAGSVVLRYVSSFPGSTSVDYYDFLVSVAPVDDAPRAITLSNNSVAENDPGAGIGVLGTTDPDLGDYHNYTLVGDLSGKFEIVSGTLRLRPGQSLDYETQSVFTVRVRTIDSTNLSFEQNLTINVLNKTDESLGGPVSIALSNGNVAENTVGAIIGTLSTQDPDVGDTHSYAIVGDDSGKFEIVGATLQLKADQFLDYESQSVFLVRVRSTDPTNQSVERDFAIHVTNDPHEIFLGTNAADTLVGTADDDDLRGLDGNDVVLGLAGKDALQGGSGDDFLFGGDNDDNLDGGSGNDTLNGGAGVDVLHGGANDDTLYVDNAADQAIEAAGEGYDVVRASVDYALGAGQEIEVLVLETGALAGTGNELANRIVGNSGSNVLDGGGGADALEGRAGDDRYYVDDVGDKVYENAGEGYDTIFATVGFNMTGQYAEKLVLTGTAAINGTGNSLDNVMIGNGAINVFDGGAGNDDIDGGAGADTMKGGAGDDRFTVDDSADRVLELTGQGYDTVYSSVRFSIAGQEIEVLNLTGSDAINGTGNSYDNRITGNSAANTLVGAAGNDRLDGGGGADRLYGGLGDDIYVIDNSGDVIIEYAGEGTADAVEASVSYNVTGQDIEILRLTGAAAINGTGNSLANIITGNAAINTLNGVAGDDALHGGLGSDTLTGGAGADSYWFETALGAANVDRITDFSVADDTIVLDRTIFSAITMDGALDPNAFWQGTAAHDADDRIVYDKATGKIYYDADGSGTGAAILFAQVTANTALTAADFLAVP